jgi:hypothetical protein
MDTEPRDRQTETEREREREREREIELVHAIVTPAILSPAGQVSRLDTQAL